MITTDATFDDFFSAREGFMRVLGEPLFLESFDSRITLFAIFDDGTETLCQVIDYASDEES